MGGARRHMLMRVQGSIGVRMALFQRLPNASVLLAVVVLLITACSGGHEQAPSTATPETAPAETPPPPDPESSATDTAPESTPADADAVDTSASKAVGTL